MKEYETPVMPIKNRIALLSVEYGMVEQEGSALVVVDRNGVRAQLPVGATAVLMLEPGTSITHAAVKLCADARTLIIWTGEGSVRLYSAGQEGAAHSYRLLRQARLALDPVTRLAVAREMYRVRFKEEAPKKRSIAQLRGMEGARVRARYKQLAEEYGVQWDGRRFDRSDWSGQDPINRAISAANSCLYGLCHAAILIGGYSAAIGFIHTGYPLAFVHDLADIWKMDLTVPLAFRTVAESTEDVATRVRHRLRDAFRTSGFLDDIVPMKERLLDAGTPGEELPDELGGARPEPADAWDAPWYQETSTGETVYRSRTEKGASESGSTGVVSVQSGDSAPAEPGKIDDSTPQRPQDEDDGEAWADEVFGAWDDPWEKKAEGTPGGEQ